MMRCRWSRRPPSAMTGLILLFGFIVGCGGSAVSSPDPGGAGGSGIPLPKGEEFDDLCDGTIEACNGFVYDVAGNVTLRTVDLGCDGAPEECDHWTYDAQNRLTSDIHDACDGAAYRCDTLSYNSDNVGDGRGDSNCDGSVDDCYSVVCSESGDVVSVETDSDCDGHADSCIAFEHDSFGRQVAKRYDLDCDGIVDECYEYAHELNAQDAVIRTTKSTCAGGVVFCSTYTYD